MGRKGRGQGREGGVRESDGDEVGSEEDGRDGKGRRIRFGRKRRVTGRRIMFGRERRVKGGRGDGGGDVM